MANQYTFPDKQLLLVEPDSAALTDLVYRCETCGCKVDCADTMKLHVEGKNHRKEMLKKSMEEDPEVVQALDHYMSLEQPHREQRKGLKNSKGKEWMDKIRAMKESMSKEELKQMEQDKKKRKREENEAIIAVGGEPPKKKKKGQQPALPEFHCTCCDIMLNSASVVQSHMTGKAHGKKIKLYDDGCWLCSIPTVSEASHFTGRKHMKRVEQLQLYGVEVETSPATLEQAALAPIQPRQFGTGHAPKIAGPASAGPVRPGMVQRSGGGVHRMVQKPGAVKREAKGDPADPTCWDFVNGKCKKGATCKWQHA